MSLALKLVLAPVLVAQARRDAQACAFAARGSRCRGRADWATAATRLRVLIAGDSSAAGVGVAHQDQAFAGHLSRALHASWPGRCTGACMHARA